MTLSTTDARIERWQDGVKLVRALPIWCRWLNDNASASAPHSASWTAAPDTTGTYQLMLQLIATDQQNEARFHVMIPYSRVAGWYAVGGQDRVREQLLTAVVDAATGGARGME